MRFMVPWAKKVNKNKNEGRYTLYYCVIIHYFMRTTHTNE